MEISGSEKLVEIMATLLQAVSVLGPEHGRLTNRCLETVKILKGELTASKLGVLLFEVATALEAAQPELARACKRLASEVEGGLPAGG